jgi:nucleoside-diphosphate-sugar epimerase
MARARQMGLSSSKIGIVGGHSAIARQLRTSHLPDALSFIRGSAAPGEREVSSYQAIGAADLRGLEAVINCAGAVRGPRQTLEPANVELPRRLAEACSAAGVSRLVHISSFSVYGDAAEIDAGTRPDPSSDYGRSKLAGDEALMRSAGSGLEAIVVRFPAIVDPTRRSGKTAQLIALWARMGILPVPAGDVRRSMISSALAAKALADIALGGGPRLTLAADPEPFSYAGAAAAIRAVRGRPVHRLRLPSMAFAPLRLFAPALATSLLGKSVLEPGSNFAALYPSDLFSTLGALALKA